ncbi:DUF1048 domain-containing protein [Leucobacter sp. GX24907]
MSSFIEKIVGDIGDKKRWREYKARVKALPTGYRTATEALERYLLYRGVIAKGDVLVSLHEEVAAVFERAASANTPIREVVGADPVEFADTLLSKYAAGEWIDMERERLIATIAEAEARGAGA